LFQVKHLKASEIVDTESLINLIQEMCGIKPKTNITIPEMYGDKKKKKKVKT